MLNQDQFDIIQNLQTFPIPQTSFLIEIFCSFLQQDGSNIEQEALLILFLDFVPDLQTFACKVKVASTNAFCFTDCL